MIIAGLSFTLVSLYITYALHKKKASLQLALFCIAGLTILIRCFYTVNFETGADASIWLASARSTFFSNNPLWWLLNSNEGRPLTVAPLLILPLLGLPLNYFTADLLGLIFFIASFCITALLIAKYTRQQMAGWLLVLPLFSVLATASHVDFFSYNSEAPSLFQITVSLWLLYIICQRPTRFWYPLALGLLLGSLPFIKFQNAPAGLIIGLFAIGYCWKNRKIKMMLTITTGALLPSVLVGVYFALHHEWQSFLNDYFANYYYYAYTLQSSADSFLHRYSPRRILAFIIRPTDTIILTIAGTISIGVLLYLTLIKKKLNYTVVFTFLFFIANLYAVVQSGWNSVHYLIYLWVPAILLVTSLHKAVMPFKKITNYTPHAVFSVIVLQIIANSYNYRTPENKQSPEDYAIANVIQQLTKPTDKIHIWGYADRLYVMAERPMGMRLCNNWWIVMPGPAQDYRTKEWIDDIEKSRPKIIVDNALRIDPHHIQFNAVTLNDVPQIAKYMQQHYIAKDTIHGAVMYERIISEK
ncbi:MAG: hypothetical protein IT252_08715 [Chitinophagaceae bacterium]|nr:hypothetical protein [Chitinophagaceae bacterium]